ncbi:MAG: integral rane protein-like protein [Edaphobacter sp.]|nr:integral rane protein-like protein [Edaphobacter sp.]
MTSSRLLYCSAVFLSAFLLFLVEPMAAKQLLPVLGGSSAVWLTCLVFFQLTLLLGYLYAHWLNRSAFTLRRQSLHLALLALAIVLSVIASLFHLNLSHGTTHPVTTIFVTLTVTIGLPFLLLGSTSPLLQVWLSRSEEGKVWYRLFALSNAGSLLALVVYPTLVEPHLSLKLQRILWSLSFVVYAILCAILSRQARSTGQPGIAQQQSPDTPPSSTAKKWLWFLLPMGAAMQLSAVTSHLTVNIAAIPLLWILPLAVYLLTFILAFEFPTLYRRAVIVRLLVLMLASLGYALSKIDTDLPIGIGILFFLVELFLACLFCHAEAYALRPRRVSETTLFYLLIAAGGAAGTFFIGIASPLLFTANYDIAISFLTIAVLALLVTWSDEWGQRLLWSTGSALLLALVILLHTANAREALVQVRNFYGALRVKQSFTPPQNAPVRMLLNGAIQHGTQLFAPGKSKIPTTYYAEDSGVGLALLHCCEDRPRNIGRNIGVIGLGAGTLAAYGTPADRIRFYEINPLVRPIAENLFTYLRNSPAQITFAEGDARASLTQEAPQHFDVLVVDAFSGDAIPLHLLTTEAIALYRRHLAANGILAFHVSNQYVDLAPEIARLADSAGMMARTVDSPSTESRGAYRAVWVLVSTNADFFNRPDIVSLALPVPAIPGLRTWTDDYSSLLPVLQLTGHY